LRPGEYAVIETEDCAPADGELFFWQSTTNERELKIALLTSDYVNIDGPGTPETLIFWRRSLRGFRPTGESIGAIPGFDGLMDGPYRPRNIRKYLLGRVAGVAQSDLGAVIEPRAGWRTKRPEMQIVIRLTTWTR
jgi:hypothetical protein